MKTYEQINVDFAELSKELIDLLISYTLDEVKFEKFIERGNIFVWFPNGLHVIWDNDDEFFVLVFWGKWEYMTIQEADGRRLLAHISKLYAEKEKNNKNN